MKLLHFSDTHLGYGAYHKTDEKTGLNQREQDAYDAFRRVIDHAVETRPDLVLHAGDLFDTVRPTNRAISFAVEQLFRLSREGIPVVVIAGNHSTPRLRETGSIFKLFENIESVHPVYRSRYEKLVFGDMALHCIPHCHSSESMEEELAKFQPDPSHKFNVGMLHGAVVGISVFKHGEFNEQEIRSGYLRSGFNYIALGHYHEACEVAPNAYYSGSTERFSFAEVGHKRKGFYEIELGSDEKPKFVEIETRPMVQLEPVECGGRSGPEVQMEIENRLKSTELAGKIIRLKVLGLQSNIYPTLGFSMFRKLASGAVHLDMSYEVIRDDQVIQQAGAQFESLQVEFERFLSQIALEGVDREKLEKLGREILQEVEP